MPAPFNDVLTHIDEDAGCAFVELSPEGFSLDLETLAATWGVLVTISNAIGPTHYSRTDLTTALRMVDRVFLISSGEGFIGGQMVGDVEEFQHAFLQKCFQSLSDQKRCLAICTNPSLLAEWTVALHFLAPDVALTAWPPQAMAA